MANSITRHLAVAVLALAIPAAAQIRRVPPVDESNRDPSLVVYLDKLKQAVANRDKAAVLALLHPQIKLGFGGEEGVGMFAPDWPALATLLRAGGAWAGDAFAIPYTSVKFPDDLDAFDHAVITGSGVRLRANPSATAETLRSLSYEIVRLRNLDEAWWEVETFLGERGFVAAAYIASPIGLRAIFQKDARGEWKMFSLVAGD